jgi:hypothetical protein
VNPGKCVSAWKRGETGYSLLEMLTPSSCSGAYDGVPSVVSSQSTGYAK